MFAGDLEIVEPTVIVRSAEPNHQHPLMIKENISILYNLAQLVSSTIDAQYNNKNQVLIALGQSPVYLLEMIKLLDNAQNRNNRKYKNVAFSGSFYKIEPNGSNGFYHIDPNTINGFDDKTYHSYLNSIGLSERDLQQSDEEFIILEICHHCNGLKSFLHFFQGYEKKPNVLYLQSIYFAQNFSYFSK